MNIRELNEALEKALHEEYKAAPKKLIDAFDKWVRADYENRKLYCLQKSGSHTDDLNYVLKDEHDKIIKQDTAQNLLKWFKLKGDN